MTHFLLWVIGSFLRQKGGNMRSINTQTLAANEKVLLNNILAYIEKNYDQRITLQSIALHFYVSKSTISHTFSRELGISFYCYVTQRRLQAAELLILQGIPLSEINEKVGFADYANFHRAFRQKHGISPRQFRKQMLLSEYTEISDTI